MNIRKLISETLKKISNFKTELDKKVQPMLAQMANEVGCDIKEPTRRQLRDWLKKQGVLVKYKPDTNKVEIYDFINTKKKLQKPTFDWDYDNQGPFGGPGSDADNKFEIMLIRGVEILNDLPQYNKDIEVLNSLELPGLKVEVCLKHNMGLGKSKSTWTEIQFTNTKTGNRTCIHNYWHPRYLLEQWNEFKPNGNNLGDLQLTKTKDKFIFWYGGEENNPLVNLTDSGQIKLLDEFINQTFSDFLKKIKDNPELEKQFDDIWEK
jgi:hypothetical protein